MVYYGKRLILFFTVFLCGLFSSVFATQTGTGNPYPWVNIKAYGAKGDGVTDDSTSINNAVAAINTIGGGILYFPAGTYIIGTAINLRNNIIYRGSGWDTILRAKASTGANVLGEASPLAAHNNIVIEDLYIDGNKVNVTQGTTDDSNQNGIRLNQVSYCTIQNVYIINTYFNGISIYNSSNHVSVLNSTIYTSGGTGGSGTKNGIFVEFGCNDIKISHNYLFQSYVNNIMVQDGGSEIDDVLIDNNYITGAKTGDNIKIGDDAGTVNILRVRIDNNLISLAAAATETGIRMYENGTGTILRSIISNNIVESNTGTGILILDSKEKQTVISGNNVNLNGGSGIADTGTGSTIFGNIVLGNTTAQITSTGTQTVQYGNEIDTSGDLISPSLGLFNNTAAPQIEVSVGNGTQGELQLNQSGVAAWHLYNTATTGQLAFDRGATNFFNLNSSGVINLNPTAAPGEIINTASGTTSGLGLNQSGVRQWNLNNNATTGTFAMNTGGADVMTLSSAGALATAAGISGTTGNFTGTITGVTANLSGGFAANVKATTSTYTVVASDYFITADGTGATYAITLPNANAQKGRILSFKKIDNTANNVTINVAPGDSIEGVALKTMSSQYDLLTLISDGTSKWYIVSCSLGGAACQ